MITNVHYNYMHTLKAQNEYEPTEGECLVQILFADW